MFVLSAQIKKPLLYPLKDRGVVFLHVLPTTCELEHSNFIQTDAHPFHYQSIHLAHELILASLDEIE